MYTKIRPTKMSIYVNTQKKTIAQVKAETGCDYIINGGLFDKYFKPCCHLKADGATWVSDEWSYNGFGWDVGPDIHVVDSLKKDSVKNYICCVEVIRNGDALQKLYYQPDMAYARERTAIGLDRDNNLILYCAKTKLTPESLRDTMLSLGAYNAIMLDGGSSTQCIFPNGKVTSNRIVNNFICVWTSSSPTTEKEKCPYAKPIINIKYGSKGSGAKWVQWMLNKVDNAGLVVDGDFGAKSVAALKNFQMKTWKNDASQWDGICGSGTRTKLQSAYDAM